MTPPPPEISVVVPAHNASRTIDACLRSLLEQDLPRERYEVIVVENGSTDDTAARIRRYPVTLVESARKGQYRALNAGIAQARGEYLALLDADCRAEPSWLAALRAAFTDEAVGGAGGPLRSASEETLVERYTVFRKILDQEKMLRDARCSPPFVVTANAMFRMDIVRRLGGFDPDLVPGDADFSWRLQWAGWRLAYAPGAAVAHFHRTTRAGLWEQVVRYGEGNAELFRKHHRRFGRRVWIDPMPYVWALKALLKIPWAALADGTPFERKLPQLDLLANAGLIAGKWRGSLRNRTWVF